MPQKCLEILFTNLYSFIAYKIFIEIFILFKAFNFGFFCFHAYRSSCVISVDSNDNVEIIEKSLMWPINPNNRCWAFKPCYFKIEPKK